MHLGQTWSKVPTTNFLGTTSKHIKQEEFKRLYFTDVTAACFLSQQLIFYVSFQEKLILLGSKEFGQKP